MSTRQLTHLQTVDRAAPATLESLVPSRISWGQRLSGWAEVRHLCSLVDDIIDQGDITLSSEIAELDSITGCDDITIPNDMTDLGEITGLVTKALPGVARGEEGRPWRKKTG